LEKRDRGPPDILWYVGNFVCCSSKAAKLNSRGRSKETGKSPRILGFQSGTGGTVVCKLLVQGQAGSRTCGSGTYGSGTCGSGTYGSGTWVTRYVPDPYVPLRVIDSVLVSVLGAKSAMVFECIQIDTAP